MTEDLLPPSLRADQRRQVHSPGNPLPNARQLLNDRYSHPHRHLIVHQGGTFYTWNGACWPPLEDDALKAEVYDYFGDAFYWHHTKNDREKRDFAPNRRKIGDVIDALRAAAHLPATVPTPSWLHDRTNGYAPATELVAVDNGLLHVPTRRVHDHTPAFYTHHAVPFDYNPDAPTPKRWLDFLNDLWPDDPESRNTLQEIFGYLIAGDTSQHKIFLLVGPKRAGKGVIGRVLTGLLGTHNVAGPTLASLGENFGLAPLVGKPLALIADARMRASSEILTERLLTISGEDLVTIDRKYQEPWTGTLATRLLLLTNELPNLRDVSGALASRFLVLLLTRSWYGHEDTDLTDKLLTELPGILTWALDGWDRLQDRGHFQQPATSADAIRALEDRGSPIRAFIRDECTLGPTEEIPIGDLYDAWKNWCEAHGRDRPGTEHTFGSDLHAAVPGLHVIRPRTDDGKRERRYQGIGLLNDEDRADQRGPVRGGPRTSQPPFLYTDIPVDSADAKDYPV